MVSPLAWIIIKLDLEAKIRHTLEDEVHHPPMFYHQQDGGLFNDPNF
jgi:hypothetical protein